MTNQEFFLETWKHEARAFREVLQALPEAKGEYKHPDDPKGKTALQLAQTISLEINSFPVFLGTGIMDMDHFYDSAPKTLAECAGMATEALEVTTDKAGSMLPEEWDAEAVMTMGGKEEWKTTRGGMAWGMLFDLIHHRGQLSTYIRPMGGKVPSIYGPSADTVNE